ncbi:uncharacterized protein LOC126740386 isoform X3 [Anthonomus grandis grandis]|uniref:uncharacterized protein LOC126740386 isoform X3 n=1 Tax=Anthonomus grandis grandis TaxID=2921223 RepID=UPI0021652828|nr:uncharacterized protein LOC126740386 isoform X3 [Anthonomus grandis grandis]
MLRRRIKKMCVKMLYFKFFEYSVYGVKCGDEISFFVKGDGVNEKFTKALDCIPSSENHEGSSEEQCVSTEETPCPRLSPNQEEENSLNEEETEDTPATDSMAWWKNKSFVQLSSDNSKVNDSPESTGSTLGRYIKNRRSKRNKRTDVRRTGILHTKDYSVKELTQRFENFKDAAECGQTENFRKSFICEMDKEMEKMKSDGFEDDFHLSMENLSLINGPEEEDQEGSSKITDDDNALYERLLQFSNKHHHPEPPDENDLFGETLFSEDLEKGLSFVETYNADGKELVICSVQVDRHSVDLNSFDEIKENTHRNSNLLTNGERALVLIEPSEVSYESKSEGTDSKRTTIYSTTSGDSYEEEENDLDHQIYSAARRETYCDDKGIVRIERVAPYSNHFPQPVEDLMPEYINTNNNYYEGNYLATQEVRREENEAEEEENYYETVRLTDESVVEVKKDTLQYILEEIKSTEKKYLEDMRRVLQEYKPFLTQRCPEKVDVVFGNMEQLYRRQCLFASILEEPSTTIKDVIEAFIDFEDLFRLYPRYFKNTPKANAAIKELTSIIKEQQERIQDKLTLSAYLLTPLQRIGKYKLFLENIIKQLEKEGKPIGSAQLALDIIKKYMSSGNDAVAIASILRSPLHTKDYGSFISREKFSLIKPKRLELMVFLFEEVVVFTTEDPKNMEQFVYLQSIKTNDLRIATFDDSTLHLTDYTKTKRRNSSKYTYILDAKNSKLKLAWKEQIEDILWKQMKKMKENTLKEYTNGMTFPKKMIPRSRENRSKSTGSSTFYVD